MRIVQKWSLNIIILLGFAAASVAQANGESLAELANMASMASVRIESQEIVTRETKSGGEERVAVISGRILSRGRVALLNHRPLALTARGYFHVEVPLRSPHGKAEKTLHLEIVNAYGLVVEKGELSIPHPHPARALASSDPELAIGVQATPGLLVAKTVPEEPKLMSSSALVPSLGFSYISYQEAGMSLTEEAITVKLSFKHPLDPSGKWSLGISGYYTAVPVATTGSPDSIRFFGLNGRMGYSPPLASQNWRFIIQGGVYYTTTFVTGDVYGFKNMFGPQIYPEIDRVLSNGGAISAYFKYAPIIDQTQLTFSNSELAGGLSYSPQQEYGWVYSLDVSSLGLSQNGFTAQSRTISLGVGVKL
jgi:hypothetical protein